MEIGSEVVMSQPPFQMSTLTVLMSFMQDHPRGVKKLIRGWNRGLASISAVLDHFVDQVLFCR